MNNVALRTLIFALDHRYKRSRNPFRITIHRAECSMN